MYKVAYHLVADNSKKKKDRSLEQLLEDGLGMVDDKTKNQEDKHDYLAILQEINQLDEMYRETLLLRYVDDMPVNKIATILGVSENVVCVRIHRGLKQLRTNIEK